MSLKPCSPNQVVIARGRSDRTGHRLHRSKDGKPANQSRPKNYEDRILCFADNTLAGDAGSPDEEIECKSLINDRPVFVFLSRWNDFHIYGQRKLVVRQSSMTASLGKTKRIFGLGIFPELGSPSSKPLNRGKPLMVENI